METTNEKLKSLNLCGMHSSKRQLLEALQVIAEAYVEMAERLKWIPISEDNLPEDFQEVLVTVVRYNGTRVVRAAEYHENTSLARKTFRILENNERWEVGEEGLIAWMPKPEPCQEKN